MMIVEIKAPQCAIGAPAWKWRQVGRSTDKQGLEDFVRLIPLNKFYHGKREYRIVGVPHD